MNLETYQRIQEEAEDVHLFDDLIEELYDKYGDPNEEREVEESLSNNSNENYGHKAWVLNQIISSMNDEDAYYNTEWLYI